MVIPLLKKEDVLEEENDLEKGKETTNDNKTRNQMIAFMEEKGYIHLPAENETDDETSDFFFKDENVIEVTIMSGIPEDVIEQMIKGNQ